MMFNSVRHAISAARQVHVRLGSIESWSQMLGRLMPGVASSSGEDMLSLVCQIDDQDRLILSDSSAAPGFIVRCWELPSGMLVASATSQGRHSFWQHVVPLSHPRAREWFRQCVDRQWLTLGNVDVIELLSGQARVALPSGFEKLMEIQPPCDLEDLLNTCLSMRQEAQAQAGLEEDDERLALCVQVLHLPEIDAATLGRLVHASDRSGQVQLSHLSSAGKGVCTDALMRFGQRAYHA